MKGYPLPIFSLKKRDFIWLATHKCKHSHSYLSHYSCFINEHPEEEKIGFLDIEASNVKADFGIIISYCIKERGKNKIYFDVINDKDLKEKNIDKRIVKNLINDLKKFHRIITYYGSRFDIPFIRTRALINDIDFIPHGFLYHDDVYNIVKNKLMLYSNRLENVAKTILKKSLKTHLKPILWIRALQGDKKSLKYILDHNKKDVLDLERIYEKLRKYIANTKKSI